MILKRKDRYAVTVYDAVTKKKIWVGTYDTRRAAVQAEAEARLDRKRKVETQETCDEFAARWIRDYPRDREATNIGYAERVKKFAEDFKGVPLDDVTRKVARRWALENPSRYKTVRTMYSDAVRDGVATANPWVNMRLAGSRGRRDITPLTVAEVFELAEKARELRGPIFEAFILCAAFTGMRPGELYALKWPQVRLQDSEVDVVASYSSKSQQTDAPKNGKTRTVVLPPPAREALAKLRRPDGFVFETVTGKRLTGRTLHYQWDPVRRAVGKPELALYELRHFCAAYLLNDLGLPAHQVAAQIGHTDGGVLVMKLYGHPSASMARDAIKAAFGANVVPLRKVVGE